MQALMLIGKGTRLPGKPFLKVRGKELFLYGYEILEGMFDRILLVCRQDLQKRLEDYGREFITEDHGVGPLGGIFEGMKVLSDDYIFVVGCDMPFLNIDVIRHLWKRMSGDGIVPTHEDGKLEPLHSFLRRESVLDVGIPEDHRITGLFGRMNVRYEPVGNLRVYDRELLTFKNINSQTDIGWMESCI